MARVKLVSIIFLNFSKWVFNRIGNISTQNKDIGVASVRRLVQTVFKSSENSEFGFSF